MAGAGSRLRGQGQTLPKPLMPLLGRPLISYLLETLARAGIKRICGVVGYESALLIAGVEPFVPSGLTIKFVYNKKWKKQNGISLLAAADHVSSPFLLTMSDHLFDQCIIDRLLKESHHGELNLAIDRKLDSIFDLDDAMKLQTSGHRITAIGKNLASYDAVDTGAFVCPFGIFDHLRKVMQDGDCSLADGVRSMAAAGQARAIDIGKAWWQDVDTPAMYATAEKHLRNRGLVSGTLSPPRDER